MSPSNDLPSDSTPQPRDPHPPHCPICDTAYTPGETLYCFTCGWNLTPLPLELSGPAGELLAAREQAEITWGRDLWSKSRLKSHLSRIHAYLKRGRQERSQLSAQIQQLVQDRQGRSESERLMALLSPTLFQMQQKLDRLQADINRLSASDNSGSSPVNADSNNTANAPVHPGGVSPDEDEDSEITLIAGAAMGSAYPGSSGSPNSTDGATTPVKIDYRTLQGLLAEGKWLEADRETSAIMLKVTGRGESSWLRMEDIEKFPIADLQTLDRLWVRHSDEHFGFSVQATIWKEMLERVKNPVEAWCEFGDRLGWHGGRNRTFGLQAPAGHLPLCSSVGVWWCSGLFPRVVAACRAKV